MIQQRVAKLLFCWLLIVASASNVTANLVVQEYDADRHNRFNNSFDFIGNAFDLSGIGRVSAGAPGRWATLISPSYFLSATHLHPGPNATVRFYASNDASGAFVDRGIESGQQIAGTDLWLGKLDGAVDASIHTYPLLRPGSLFGQTIHVVGQNGATGMRMGRNVIDHVLPNFDDDELASQGDAFTFDYDASNGLGQDEAWTQSGDSGGPSFAVVDGQLVLAGIHWFNYEDEETLEVGSGDTLVSSYLSELTNAMAGESFSTVAIPEASAVWMGALLVVGTGLMPKRSRRYRS